MSHKTVCPYCHRPARLVTGNRIYPHRPDLFDKHFWQCESCEAWVGCHPPKKHGKGGVGDGTVPLGRLANKALRIAKTQAHAAFDPIWRSGAMSRSAAYGWLANQLGVSKANCHIGMMDEDACRSVVVACESRLVGR